MVTKYNAPRMDSKVEAHIGDCSFLLVAFIHLEDTEGLLSGLCALGFVCDNIETNSLGKRTALSDGYDITILDGEGRRAVSRDILVPLLVTTVLGNVVQIIPSDNNGSLHLGGDDLSLQNSSTDRNVSSEGALLVNVTSLDGSIGSLDSKTNVLDETHGLGSRCIDGTLACDKDSILLLVCLFVL